VVVVNRNSEVSLLCSVTSFAWTGACLLREKSKSCRKRNATLGGHILARTQAVNNTTSFQRHCKSRFLAQNKLRNEIQNPKDLGVL
jgi:hypothetical protein